MTQKASTLSQKMFAKMVSGGKKYLPAKAKKELMAAGIDVGVGRIDKTKALKAFRHLRSKKMAPTYKPSTTLFDYAAIEQHQLDEIARKIERDKHVRANIFLDIEDEAKTLAQSDDYLWSNPRYRRSRRVIEEADLQRQKREQKIASEKTQRQKLANGGADKSARPEMLNFPSLPDMDIG